MNSFLITGGDQQERLNKAKALISNFAGRVLLENNPDLLIVKPDPSKSLLRGGRMHSSDGGTTSIGIKQVRALQKFLCRKPYQAKAKVVLIPEAEKLTLPAQNCFLKTLEEPPENSLIFLCCPYQDQLLPTIISRCQLIKLIPKSQIKISKSLITNYQSLITKIAKASPGQRLKLIEPYTKSREEAIKFCQEMIVVLREVMMLKAPRIRQLADYKNTNKNNSSEVEEFRLIASFQKTLSLLQSNINVKLALENLVLNLPNQ